MRPTIYIHAGMHKTGTTSIQTTLFRNRRWLQRHGANYLSISENHSTTLYPLFSAEPHRLPVNARKGFDTEEKAARRNAAIRKALTRALAANTSPRLVVSGEELLSLPPPGLSGLKQALAPHAGDLRAIVYVREPIGYVSSAFQEMLRNGFAWDALVANPPAPQYRRIQKLIDAFGRDHVDIRVYDRARLHDGDLMADFLSAVGLEPRLAREFAPVRINRSLCHEAVLLVAALNRRYPTPYAGALNPAIDYEVFKILGAIEGRPFRCPAAVYRRLQPAVADDVAWLNETMGETVFSYEPPADDAPEPGNDETATSLAVALNELARDSKWSLRRLLRGGRALPGSPDDTVTQMLADWIARRRTV
jgi:hypothetical protein